MSVHVVHKTGPRSHALIFRVEDGVASTAASIALADEESQRRLDDLARGLALLMTTQISFVDLQEAIARFRAQEKGLVP